MIAQILKAAAQAAAGFLGAALGQGFGNAVYDCIKADIDYFWLNDEQYFRDHPEDTDKRRTVATFFKRLKISAQDIDKQEAAEEKEVA